MRKVLALNRGEIAIRIMRAATELGLTTVGIYSKEDRLTLHRFKADEAYEIGANKGPVEAYLDVDGIVALASDGIDLLPFKSSLLQPIVEAEPFSANHLTLFD